ncbi:MAG: hypothetical protein NDI69_05575 [Bacteriovoracaceae bacterium]|nr:hypothetical protein [Bacteriovoracaceae bacterium]
MKKIFALVLLALSAQSFADLDMDIKCTFRTSRNTYLTAVGGGNRTTDVIHSDARVARAWEIFTIVDSRDGSSPVRYGIKTATGHFLSAQGGGGRITDVIHSNRTQLLDWEKFQPISLGNGWYNLKTISGNYVTAVGGGRRITDVIHTDATVASTWERFKIRCWNAMDGEVIPYFPE